MIVPYRHEFLNVLDQPERSFDTSSEELLAGSLDAQQREAFFGTKRSGFGGKRSLQKSKSHLFAQ
jgi:hypothetical protein